MPKPSTPIVVRLWMHSLKFSAVEFSGNTNSWEHAWTHNSIPILTFKESSGSNGHPVHAFKSSVVSIGSKGQWLVKVVRFGHKEMNWAPKVYWLPFVRVAVRIAMKLSNTCWRSAVGSIKTILRMSMSIGTIMSLFRGKTLSIRNGRS